MNFPKVCVCPDVGAVLPHAICDEHQKQSAAQTAPNVFFLGPAHSFRLI